MIIRVWWLLIFVFGGKDYCKEHSDEIMLMLYRHTPN